MRGSKSCVALSRELVDVQADPHTDEVFANMVLFPEPDVSVSLCYCTWMSCTPRP